MLKIWICFCIFLIDVYGVSHNATKLQGLIRPKIVNGSPARLGEFPYQLSLRNSGSHFCGASLVSVFGILVGVTAAHCVVPEAKSSPFYAVAGTVRLSGDELQQTRNISKIVVHENFNISIAWGDIALLFFDKPFRLNMHVGTISLPPVNMSTSGDLMVTGWGRLHSEGPLPNVLQKLRTPLMPVKECKERYDWAPFVVNLDSNICSIDDGRGICDGDSGSSAKSVMGGYLAGVPSWSAPFDCGGKDYPAVYTKVSFYVPWIYKSVFRYIINHL